MSRQQYMPHIKAKIEEQKQTIYEKRKKCNKVDETKKHPQQPVVEDSKDLPFVQSLSSCRIIDQCKLNEIKTIAGNIQKAVEDVIFFEANLAILEPLRKSDKTTATGDKISKISQKKEDTLKNIEINKKEILDKLNQLQPTETQDKLTVNSCKEKFLREYELYVSSSIVPGSSIVLSSLNILVQDVAIGAGIGAIVGTIIPGAGTLAGFTVGIAGGYLFGLLHVGYNVMKGDPDDEIKANPMSYNAAKRDQDAVSSVGCFSIIKHELPILVKAMLVSAAIGTVVGTLVPGLGTLVGLVGGVACGFILGLCHMAYATCKSRSAVKNNTHSHQSNIIYSTGLFKPPVKAPLSPKGTLKRNQAVPRSKRQYSLSHNLPCHSGGN